jgi:hypothetical protein
VLVYAGPLLVYLIERLVRLVRGNQNTILQKLVGHPSRVLGTYTPSLTHRTHGRTITFPPPLLSTRDRYHVDDCSWK